MRVAINGRDAEGGAAALKQLGEGAIFVKGDVAEPGQVPAIIETVQRKLGPIHILVTNAGGPPPGEFHEHAIEVWRRAIDVNMLSAVEAVQLVLPGMKKARFRPHREHHVLRGEGALSEHGARQFHPRRPDRRDVDAGARGRRRTALRSTTSCPA